MAESNGGTVRITIDDQPYDVPAGMNLVDAAKWAAGNDIPVFCYHPKMAAVGMCRVCLVELGSIQRDRETGEILRDEAGEPQVRWFPTLQTACTQVVSDGLVVRTATKAVEEARESVLEFLLSSHPLDCPICDKGGECPLQNLTMRHGPGISRMQFTDKMQLNKHVPLGELIFLDEERCIQCARCVRFQDEIVGDDVLAFHERGRSLRIITNSEPGFDSYFSGNTTDICPVGALTTTDFRFAARPWELREVPSICPYDAAGSNISLSVRLDRDFGGRALIKRVMPRQNEAVNEIWISDKTRFGHHFTRSEARCQEPQVAGTRADWAAAIHAAAERIRQAEGDIAVLAGPTLSNEDLWELCALLAAAGAAEETRSERLALWPPTHGGGELLAQVGLGQGSNLGQLGAGDAVLVIACDLEEEVPVWRLRLKQAAERGVTLVVANARGSRLDDFASKTVRYDVGAAARAFLDLTKTPLGRRLADAENLVIVAGAEGLDLRGSRDLAQAAANFLLRTKHVGRPNNGLLIPLPGPNGVGARLLGYTPENTVRLAQQPPKVLILADADPLVDDPSAASWLEQVESVIQLSLFAGSRTAVTLPIASFAERDGSYTNGERRVQRFYTAQGPLGAALPAWQVVSRIAAELSGGQPKRTAAAVMAELCAEQPVFAGADFPSLARVARQFPDVGGEDLYYGGTAYRNTGGLGVQLASAADRGEKLRARRVRPLKPPQAKRDELLVIPTVSLYNRERRFAESSVMHERVAAPYVEMNRDDAEALVIEDGERVTLTLPDGDALQQLQVRVNGRAPQGALLLPRQLSDIPVPFAPFSARVTLEEVAE
ncbi:MAG: 2Fe-2S iron-sulfur cluster-binding protein [Anaerolineaceae bacterium]|nr:2Fe-2S iron-sulfur cluster-binding protein [Anaerolineaceae bacterium]